MTAIETLTAGLFDYAGLYPPASLSLPSAANNYIEYASGKHAAALGRFIVNSDRLDEFRSVAGNSLSKFRLSVIADGHAGIETVVDQQRSGMLIEAVEIKCGDPAEIEQLARRIPAGIDIYFEVAMDASDALHSVATAQARAKIRMGGIVPDAFPSVATVAQMLRGLADLRLAFKATAGLHHPIRSRQPLTYQPQSNTGVMHGFMNLCCAAALVLFGHDVREAEDLLAEEDPSAWKITAESVTWRGRTWTSSQLSRLRREFLISIGSCSFHEPIRDMESLGWL